MKQILLIALSSRIILLITSFLFDILINDYDTSSSIGKENGGFIWSCFGHLVRWDSLYFLEIAQFGYLFEQFHAFFPLFPLFIRAFSLFLGVLDVPYHSQLLLSSIVISNSSFVAASLVLFELSREMFRSLLGFNEEDSIKWSKISVILFCLSPSNIFLISPYTESLFCLLSFCGFLCVQRQKWWIASLFFSLSVGVRSNGFLYSGFFLFRAIRISALSFISKGKKNNQVPVWRDSILQILTVLLPFLLFQYYTWTRYCNSSTDIVVEGYEEPSWCSSFIPFSYSAIQDKYWNQGFLRYWQIKQIPNFLLASPIFLLSLFGSIQFLKLVWKKHLGNLNSILRDDSICLLVLPMAIYWIFFLLIILLFFHVQTMTRFITPVPMLYWFVSLLFYEQSYFGAISVGYFLFFNLLGALLYSNFYPFT
eukprot:TRINITY_DN1940_c0_g2_i1.p1 TRINITY_DN1940_c0_g2~~TRINITY_DN1940_c0_g2_i1.p1  ORF type:complete len:423 (+),score=106.86 TRINITY_DN1940_c0_g2_i1:29-1297(+)